MPEISELLEFLEPLTYALLVPSGLIVGLFVLLNPNPESKFSTKAVFTGGLALAGSSVLLCYLQDPELLRPLKEWQWLLYLLCLAIFLRFETTAMKAGRGLQLGSLVIVAAITGWLITPTWGRAAEHLTAWRVGLALSVLLCTCLLRLAAAFNSEAICALGTGVAALGLAVFLELTGHLRLVYLALPLASCLITSALLALRRGESGLHLTLVDGLGLLTPGLLASAYVDRDESSEIPIWCYITMALATLPLLIATKDREASWRGWTRIGAVSIIVTVTLIVAGLKAEPPEQAAPPEPGELTLRSMEPFLSHWLVSSVGSE